MALTLHDIIDGAFGDESGRADLLQAAESMVRQYERGAAELDRMDETAAIVDRVDSLAALESQALAIFAAVRPTADEYADLEIPAFLRRT